VLVRYRYVEFEPSLPDAIIRHELAHLPAEAI
jgi:hypothetical protein